MYKYFYDIILTIYFFKGRHLNKTFILLGIDMSFSLSGIEEHTNDVLKITNNIEEMNKFVSDNNIVLDTEILLYHSNYKAYTIQVIDS